MEKEGKIDIKTPISHYHASARTLYDSEQGRIHGNPVADGWAGAIM